MKGKSGFARYSSVILGFLLLGAVPARAQTQEMKIASYVTNENKDVFVAIFSGAAMVFNGCKAKENALDVMELPLNTKIIEETEQNLKDNFGLGQYPSIPCPGTAYDKEIPGDIPLWADLEKSKNYFLEFPKGSGRFFTIPSQCSKLKTAFGIRQRVSLPGVLQEEQTPDPSRVQKKIELACGKGGGTTPDTRPDPGTATQKLTWRIYHTETYLTEFGDAEFVYVAVYQNVENGVGKKYFLPIYKIDGKKTSEILWDPTSEQTQLTEKKLRELFNAQGEIGELPFQDIEKLNLYPFLDVCLNNCQVEGRTIQHAYFAHQGDTELATVKDYTAVRGINVIGDEEYSWSYGTGLAVRFSACPKIVKAIGLNQVVDGTKGIKEDFDSAIDNAEKDAKVFKCDLPPENLCVRQVLAGETLTANHFRPTGDCKNKNSLRLELQGNAVLKNTVVLQGSASPGTMFKRIEIVGANGNGRGKIESQIKDQAEVPSSDCLFEKIPSMFFVKGLDAVSFRNIDFLLGENTTLDKGLGIHGENVAVTFENVQMGSIGGGGNGEGNNAPKLLSKNLRFCKSSVFSFNSSFMADMMNMQVMATNLLMYGKSTDVSRLRADEFAVVLNSHSYMRTHNTGIISQRPFQLKDSSLFGTRSLIQSSKGRLRAQAFRLSGDSEVTFKYTAVKEFEKIGIFMDKKGKMKFILPTNDLRADNDQLSWGEGQFEILE